MRAVKLWVVIIFLLYAGLAKADVAVLENGKKLTFQLYELQGDSIRLILSDRAEMVVPSSWIREIQPAPPVLQEPPPVVRTAIPKSHAYGEMIRKASRKYRMDWRLVAAVMEVESNFNPAALSPKGAQGLMQLMPETARLYRVRNPYDPKQNVEAGVKHLRMLLKRFQGDLTLALAAYNSGEKTVDRYGGVPPYQETREYVRKVLALYQSI